MIKLIDKFSRKDLPFNNKMKKSWDDNGYLIISDFYKDIECDKLRSQAQKLIKNYNHDDYVSFFDTKNQNHANDKYFLESGDKIRFFFENKAFDKKGNLNNSIDLVINKIGHALHDLDPVFEKFSKRRDLDQIAKFIGINNPKLLQSMYIFKQPRIGGEVHCHQDSTFLYTIPESVVGFWVALEDANLKNGCLWVAKGAHKGPLRKIFLKDKNKTIMKTLNNKNFEKTNTPLEVKKGSLVLLHGRLPHCSGENSSINSRHAYTLHVINGDCEYPKNNWLQRPHMPLNGFLD